MNEIISATAQRKPLHPPLSGIFHIENHDEALPIWRNSGGTDRIVVHVDAHHDMWWNPPGHSVGIANFISPALRDGLLREIHWVVPDRSWESTDNRRQVLHHLRRIQAGFPGRPEPVQIRDKSISTALLGKPLHICSVEGLPMFREDVLLDLDVDYLILPRVTYDSGDPHPALPWIWPEDLLSRLQTRIPQSGLVTIACSVYGGFTPLRWKYLGAELEARLRSADSVVLHGMDLMRSGAEAAARGDFSAAEEYYSEAAGCVQNFAAPYWHLAYLYLDSGRTNDGQRMYQLAVSLDPTYRTPFNSDAVWDFRDRRWNSAKREYSRTLELDPTDAYAHLGIGWLAAKDSKWNSAETALRLAAENRPDLVDAHRALGKVLQKLGRRREALQSYEKSLKLALAGQHSLDECPATAAEYPKLNDRGHFDVYSRLGKLCLDLGELDRAGQYLRIAAAGGADSVVLRSRLAFLAFRQRRWKMAALELAHLGKQFGVQSGRHWRRLRRGIRRPFVRAHELWQVR